ncbi:MAG: SpoIIIAH-like family protein [Firmicutes bacterium]|nr:SpoIIIAH-like family protein [Bacillota bacterium]
MINKQSIWFTFLFSIILVLSIFYITMDTEKLDELILDVDTNDTTLVVNESTELVALRVQDDEETLDTINELQNILLDETSDLSAKNDAYDQLLSINSNKRIESSLEKIIKDEFKLDSFVKLKNNNVTVFIDSSDHDYKLANDIIRRLSKEFNEDRYITVKFG